jgi:hypothetical protein
MNDLHRSHDCETAVAAKHYAPKKWGIEIDVFLTDIGPPPDCKPVFTIDTFMPMEDDPDDPRHQRIIFHNAGREDGFTINFQFYDNTDHGNGSGYYFPDPPDPKNPGDPNQWPLWSQKGPGCPPPGQWAEFEAVGVSKDRLTLVVENLNQTKTLFGYALRVRDDDGNWVTLDPGGNNMNGSGLRGES